MGLSHGKVPGSASNSWQLGTSGNHPTLFKRDIKYSRNTLAWRLTGGSCIRTRHLQWHLQKKVRMLNRTLKLKVAGIQAASPHGRSLSHHLRIRRLSQKLSQRRSRCKNSHLPSTQVRISIEATLHWRSDSAQSRNHSPHSVTTSGLSRRIIRCEVCNREFKGAKAAGNCNRHRKEKHHLNKELFPCRHPPCRAKYSRNEYRIKHEKKLHGARFE